MRGLIDYLPKPNADTLLAVDVSVGRGAAICDRVASPALVIYWLAFLLPNKCPL
jgi:hypothetical protein